MAQVQARIRSTRGARYNGMIEGASGATHGEANGMRDMRERVHIRQMADKRFEFTVDGDGELYAFVCINGCINAMVHVPLIHEWEAEGGPRQRLLH